MPGRGDNNKHGTSGQGSSNQSNQPFVNTSEKEPASNQSKDERRFDLLVDSVPYLVKASPFTFNEEIRYYISVNGGEDHVFTWDPEVSGLRAIDDTAASIPSALEEEISQRLRPGVKN